MPRPRSTPSNLPPRVYERMGARVYSIGLKLPGGSWAWRMDCAAHDAQAVASTRAQAVQRATRSPLVTQGVATMADALRAWLAWQNALPRHSPERRADSTLAINAKEAQVLEGAIGHISPEQLTKTHAYDYLDACVQAQRPAKGNKEIALAHVVLEWLVRKGRLPANPFDRVRKNRVVSAARYVTDAELAITLEAGRTAGGSLHIIALALQAAYLCLRRSVEVRALTRDQIKADGILWADGKASKARPKPPVLIEWSPALRSVIDEALSVKRNAVAGTWYVFGNQQGQRYSKGGWKAMLNRLMMRAQSLASARGVPFERFSLQDCRPKGNSDKRARGDADVVDAMGHSSEKLSRTAYDRRKARVAKPAA